MAPVGAAAAARQADPILTRIVEQDQRPWYRKRNLRRLYMLLLPTCIGIEITSGFDSQMINTVQISPVWQTCRWVCVGARNAADECRLQSASRGAPWYHLCGIQPWSYLCITDSAIRERYLWTAMVNLLGLVDYGCWICNPGPFGEWCVH
jgi:hypothetical protein